MSSSGGTPEIVTLGECLISLVAAERAPLSASRIFVRFVAGAEANVAVGLARLGRTVGYIGRVGDDGFGRLIARELRGEGVDVRALVADGSAATGLMVRETRDIGPSEVIYHRAGSAGSRLSAGDVDAASPMLGGASWLHLTGITAAISRSAAGALERAIELARAGGATISLDLNIRRRLWPESVAAASLRTLASRCDVVLGGLDEVAVVGGLATTLEMGAVADPDAAAEAMLALGVRRVVVKLGAAGALERRRDAPDGPERTRSPARRVPTVVDPVGAGDAFSAGYIALTLEGADPERALAAANACGAAVVATLGDMTGLPTRAELDRMLSAVEGPDTLR
jgi:2-dehydro-3-deoxygluconokinase